METKITIEGYGFELYCSEEALIKFIKNHHATIEQIESGKEILADIKNGSTDILEKYYDLTCETTGNTGARSIIANVMSRESKIDFSYYESYDNSTSDIICYTPSYPWQLSKEDKALTEEKLDEIVRKYADEVGVITTIGYVMTNRTI